MLIGIPKEIKPDEYRVGLVPATIRELLTHGHEVAASIARAGNEELIEADVAEKPGDEAVLAARVGAGGKIRRAHVGSHASSDPRVIGQALAQVNERLLVVTRGLFPERYVFELAAARRVPILVVEPPEQQTTPGQ